MTGSSTDTDVRVAVMDVDSGFLQVLANRMDRLGWQHRVLPAGAPPQDVVGMRVAALVVDLALLGPRGWEYLDRLCREVPGLAVVICTGRSSVAQRVRGLRMGADDWVTKPCHPEEVIARIEVAVRRRRAAATTTAKDAIAAGGLTIRPGHFQAYAGERSLELTRREFELLHLLACHDGRVLEREEIYGRIWGYTMARGDRSVDVFVRKLRHKLERGSPGWRYIHTHFGVGYRFGAEAVGDAEPPDGPEEARAEDVAPTRARVTA